MERSLTDTLAAAGRAALARNEWEEARRCFQAAVDADSTPEAYEGLAEAAWWLSDEAATFDARERAYRLYRERGDAPAAARMAMWLATDSVEFRGEPAVANGWIQRAHRLLDGLEPGPAHGWLAVWEGHLALMLDNDTPTARRLAGQAVALGRSLGDVDIEMLALAVEGLALVSGGEVAAGVRRLDEAAAAAMSGEMSDLNAAATAMCYLIDACSRVRDYDRASQWCTRVREWAAANRFEVALAACRPLYAVVLMWRGAWDEAEAELYAARRELLVARPPMAVESVVRLAELRWRQGRWDEAAVLFAEVEHEGLSQLGRAELALDRGDAGTAADLAERFLRRIPPENRIERVSGLDVAVRAAVALGNLDHAMEPLAELRVIAESVRTDALRASVSFAGGLVAAARGNHETARRCLEDAVDLFDRNGAPFETGRARIALAQTLRSLGRSAAAVRETSAAFHALRGVGASREAERAATLLRELEAHAPVPTHTGGPDPSGLTAREIEVLRHIAAGKSNQEIAEDLVLSLRTIERHISNIYEKIGASGKVARATATAYAFQHGLTIA